MPRPLLIRERYHASQQTICMLAAPEICPSCGSYPRNPYVLLPPTTREGCRNLRYREIHLISSAVDSVRNDNALLTVISPEIDVVLFGPISGSLTPASHL